MKTFHCTACGALVFFENTRCLSCGHQLAFVAREMAMLSLEPQPDGTRVAVGAAAPAGRAYRLCRNYSEHDICNWAVPVDSSESLCASCILTQTIPDLAIGKNREAWLKLEMAKRRLVFDLLTLQLPLQGKLEDPAHGLEFEFLSDFITVNGDRSRVLTGHDNGLITINVAEADDLYRETERIHHGEPLRTLLGHFRHEVGHYYWDRLIQGSDHLQSFRELFGNEQVDYQAALQAHYEHGAPANWSDNYISAYASTHPWEDWAETWAHVMHMVDALETAHAVGMSVKPSRKDEPVMGAPARPLPTRIGDFDLLLGEWYALTYVLNNLTRGLGLQDAYPFVLSATVVAKLQFVAEIIANSSRVAGVPADAAATTRDVVAMPGPSATPTPSPPPTLLNGPANPIGASVQ